MPVCRVESRDYWRKIMQLFRSLSQGDVSSRASSCAIFEFYSLKTFRTNRVRTLSSSQDQAFCRSYSASLVKI